ncbi:MAG: DUF2922 domain-containing protein [Clostridiaceae bacterium]
MEYSLTMTFVTSGGDKASLTITGVKSTITQLEVSTLMDTIITNNVFLTKTGSLTAKYGAQLTERQVTQFTV